MNAEKLLRSKNRCLARFLDLSSRCLGDLEKGDFSGLDLFTRGRDSVLRAISLFDRKLAEAVSLVPPGGARQRLAKAILPALDERDELIRRILLTDHGIMKLLEAEGERLQGELACGNRSQAMLRKFKSGWVSEAGEELDRKL